MTFDAIIIGGGAAGLFCALQAGRRGRRVLVIEHNSEVGRKITISGGGRCNFTNLDVTHENFVSQNPHFCKSALANYSSDDFIELVRSHHIAYYEKTLGQLFCRDSSRDIVEMLLAECRDAKVRIETSCAAIDVFRRDEQFVITTNRGEFTSASLVVACGGLSFPKVGATSFGFKLAKQFGHTIIETRPSLVAMMADQAIPELSGIAFDASVTAGKQIFKEKVLFTHRGFSGPAILQASNYWIEGRPIIIDMLPGRSITELLKAERGRKTAANFFSKIFPQRLADSIAREINIDRTNIAELNTGQLKAIDERIHNWHVNFTRTEGYSRAEVTLGGVDTSELSSKTMGSRRVNGLYFIGEIVDVTGWLGGYNFQWAWSSGYAAAQSL